jgi:hypothetical protein
MGDGERAFRFARASESFAGGATVGAVVTHCAESMGLAVGNSPAQAAVLDKVLYHGWTVHGAASSELDRILRAVGYAYSIQSGVIQILSPDESVSQSIPVVSAAIGNLIGSPEMGTPEKKGKPPLLKFTALLIPEALPGGRVRVVSERYDGIFRTRKVEHDCDTESGPWYSHFESVADGTVQLA